MVRFLVSLLTGAAVTFGLFALMAYLISSSDRGQDKIEENIVVEVNTTPPKSSADTRRRVPPPPPPPPKVPPKPAQPEPEPASNTAGGISFNAPSLDMGNSIDGMAAPGSGFMRDGEATPIVRIDPKYPPQAARDGIEGWVKLSFTINEIGGVEDVEVLDAEPKRVFDKEAKRALRKWKYKPKVVEGKPQRQPGLSVQLDFKIDKG